VKKGELPFVRSFARRSFVRMSAWSKENDNVDEKTDDEGKKEQK
jgi:hypothetical protein